MNTIKQQNKNSRRSHFKNFQLSKTSLNLVFVVALAFSLDSFRQVKQLIAANAWVTHTYKVMQTADASLYQIVNIESQQRNYIITNNEHVLISLDQLRANLKFNLQHLIDLTSDHEEQKKRSVNFSKLANKRLELLDEVIQLKRNNKLETPEGVELLHRSQDLSIHVKDLGSEIKAIESVLLSERNSAAVKDAAHMSFILIVGNSISIIFLLIAFLLTNIELIQRKKAQEKNKTMQARLRKIIESASDMIAALDKSHRFLIFNEAYQYEFKRLFGKLIRVGMSLEHAFSEAPETQKELMDEWRNSLEIHVENKTIEVNIDSKKHVYELTSNLIQDNENEIIGTVQCIRNITQRIQEHVELQESYQKLALGMDELQDKNNQITLLVEMSDIMLACSSQEELSEVMAKYSQRILMFSRGYLYVMHPSKNYLEVAASWGNPSQQESTFTPDHCWAIRLGRVHHVGASHHELICDHVLDTQPNSSLLCTPLMAQNDIYGLLYLESVADESTLFNENQRLLINAFSELAALALANVRLRENLRYQSIRDPLTGLYNRRYLDDFLFKLVHQSERSGVPSAILMLDLDHFKKINDTYGHDAGDLVLKELGRILISDVQLGDIASRYGGEEFTLVFYNTNRDSAKIRAEEIRKNVSMLQVKYGAQIVGPISISIGIANYPEDAKTTDELIEIADKALYTAKHKGGNMVAVFSEKHALIEQDKKQEKAKK